MPTTWIPSAEAFGTPTLGTVLGPTGIPSAEAFGTADITHSSVILVRPTGIPSAESFGTLTTGLTVSMSSIPSGEAFGTPDVNSTTTVLLNSGRAYGRGSLTIGRIVLAGTINGSGVLVPTFFVRILSLDPVIYGHGRLLWSGPGLLEGYGTITGFLAIAQVPPPVCGPVCGCGDCCGRREENCEDCRQWHGRHHHREPWWWQCRECWLRHAWHRRDEHEHGRDGHQWSREPNPGGRIGSFRWNQTLGRGDLEICLQDRWRNQRGPVFIGYTMFMVSPTGVLHQVGPTDWKPAQWDVGKFYVTGTAGENGQPGCWAVRWRYQKTYSEPIVEQLVQFRVLDAVLDCDRPDHLRRKCKFGWDL